MTAKFVAMNFKQILENTYEKQILDLFYVFLQKLFLNHAHLFHFITISCGFFCVSQSNIS